MTTADNCGTTGDQNNLQQEVASRGADQIPNLPSQRPTNPGDSLGVLSTMSINEFKIPVALVDVARCGKYDGAITADIQLIADGIDENGFVTEVDEFIDEIRRVFAAKPLKASCEELGYGIASIAIRVVGPRLQMVHVRVFNHTGNIATTWNKGNKVPEFPRAATDREIEIERSRPQGQRRSVC
jgi:hypothetical protein